VNEVERIFQFMGQHRNELIPQAAEFPDLTAIGPLSRCRQVFLASARFRFVASGTILAKPKNRGKHQCGL
jgi:hypothetical protein